MPNPKVSFNPRQVQRKFKHAPDFGIVGNYNQETLQQFIYALQAHVETHAPVPGRFRGVAVFHYYAPGTHLNVMVDSDGNFISAWRLDVDQRSFFPILGGG